MISTVPQLTDDGKALLMRALAGEKLTFTRMGIGNGELAEGEDFHELHALINEKLSITPTEMDRSQEGLVAITGDFTSADIVEDFKWTELGIFAMGEDETELLYAYANDGEDAGMLRVITTQILTEQTLTLVVAVDDAENIEVLYNPHMQYADARVLAGHMNDHNNPHQVTAAQLGLGSFKGKNANTLTPTFTEAGEETVLTEGDLRSGSTTTALMTKIAAAVRAIIAHVGITSGNPHNVTKDDLELGNVVNSAPSDMTIAFTQADQAQALTPGDLFSGTSLSTLMTKIAAAVHGLIAHVGTTTGNPHNVKLNDLNTTDARLSFFATEWDARQNYAVPVSGENMSTIMSKVAKDLADVQTHLDTTESPNPHGISLAKIGTAGTYTGDGSVKRGINLGYVPSAVYVCDEWGQVWDDVSGVRGGMIIGALGVRSKDSSDPDDARIWSNQYTALLAGEDTVNEFAGFWVNRYAGSTAEENISTNENGVVYHYVAFR